MTKTKNSDLTIVILNFNSQFWLKKTLDSLKSHYLDKTKSEVEVVVVDNNSQDESVKMIEKDFSWVKLIKLQENIGYSAGNNLALEASQSRYTMLLNPDVEFTEDSNLDDLIDFLDENSGTAVVTPKVLLANGKIDPACHRGEPTPWASLTYFLGLEKLFPLNKRFSQYHQWYKNLSEPHPIDACSGAAMIVRTSTMEKVGLLDERFFMYAEDLDWCKRFRDAGFQIHFIPKVKVIHHKYKSGLQSSSSQIARKTSHHFYDTMLQYYDKHYHSRYPVVVRFIIKYFLKIKKGIS